jgi:hypothetical protein
MRERLTANALRALGVLVVGAVLMAPGGCDSLFNGFGADQSLDGTWNVALQPQVAGGATTTFTLTVANGQPTQVQVFAPPPLNFPVTVYLDGVQRAFFGATFMGTGSLARNADGSVTVTITVTATYLGQTLEGTLNLHGTLSGSTITGTATGTGSAPGLGIPSGSASINFTMTKQ